MVIISMGVLLSPSVASGTSYYVDSRSGNDTNTGISKTLAWKTLNRVNSQTFVPGDTIFFRRDSNWSGELKIDHSGAPNNPIVYSAYNEGINPIIKNPGVDRGSSIRITADHVVVEYFLVKEAHEGGIIIMPGADYNIVRNNEATLTGTGVSVRGKHNFVTENYAHDLTMIVNDEGGDNDYGAVGVWLFNSNNEVSYNTMIDCIAPSLDYGHDGGVVEFYGDVDSCYVHHNWGENCDGGFEFGGRGDTLTGILIAYNIFINNGIAGGFHVGGKFGVYMEDLRAENNLFVEEGVKNHALSFWNGTPTKSEYRFRNNIFFIPNFKGFSNHSDFAHDHNLYYLGGLTDIGIPLGPGDLIGDPQFNNLVKRDFHLQEGSPAIDAGADLFYEIDYEGNAIPFGPAPDIGPYEYRK